MQDIGKVEIGKKDAMILYDKAGRKLITADGLTENYDRLQSSLKANGKNAVKKELPIYRCNTLEECMTKANEVAKSGDVVLFSPASASFDMYKNFMERGNKFKDLVMNI